MSYSMSIQVEGGNKEIHLLKDDLTCDIYIIHVPSHGKATSMNLVWEFMELNLCAQRKP